MGLFGCFFTRTLVFAPGTKCHPEENSPRARTISEIWRLSWILPCCGMKAGFFLPDPLEVGKKNLWFLWSKKKKSQWFVQKRYTPKKIILERSRGFQAKTPILSWKNLPHPSKPSRVVPASHRLASWPYRVQGSMISGGWDGYTLGEWETQP